MKSQFKTKATLALVGKSKSAWRKEMRLTDLAQNKTKHKRKKQC